MNVAASSVSRCCSGTTLAINPASAGPARRAIRSVASRRALAAGRLAGSGTTAGITTCSAGRNTACAAPSTMMAAMSAGTGGAPDADHAATAISRMAARAPSAAIMAGRGASVSANRPASSTVISTLAGPSATSQPAQAPNAAAEIQDNAIRYAWSPMAENARPVHSNAMDRSRSGRRRRSAPGLLQPMSDVTERRARHSGSAG